MSSSSFNGGDTGLKGWAMVMKRYSHRERARAVLVGVGLGGLYRREKGA